MDFRRIKILFNGEFSTYEYNNRAVARIIYWTQMDTNTTYQSFGTKFLSFDKHKKYYRRFVSNIFDDDGIEDAFDLDIDGDGFSNEERKLHLVLTHWIRIHW